MEPPADSNQALRLERMHEKSFVIIEHQTACGIALAAVLLFIAYSFN
jgi:hypothetical protein